MCKEGLRGQVRRLTWRFIVEGLGVKSYVG